MAVCPKCGQENPENFRFCGACGAPLREAAAPREARKTVTVVFCDVTSSTSLGERLDPESLRRVMSRYFDEMRAVLERHGGKVEKFIGDAVMAVFGIPQLHEDDALRAVRSAVEMQAGLAALNDELERERGVRLAARIGVNTGEVVAGDPAAGQALVTGDAVNVAARLEQAARPDEILIGETTYLLVRDAVEAERVEPLAAKGREALVPARRLHAVAEGAQAFGRRLDAPMVGREDELAQLRQAFGRAGRDCRCYLFTVLGPAGIGKSRLARELGAAVEEAATVLGGRCLPYGEGITFWPLVEILQQLPGAAADESLLDATAPEQIFRDVRKLFEGLARERPLVLVLEDIHWAEPTFLDLIEHLADWTRNAPLLLLCLARPELLEKRRAWGGGKVNATTILLEPLSESESEALIEDVLGAASLTAETRAQIVESAEGNPLFVEQMLAMIAADRPTDGQLSVPPTIQALLAARLDNLSGEERGVIERASIVGQVFELGDVLALAPEDTAAASSVMALVRKELIQPDPSGEDAFRFRHILIRDAAYRGIAKELRATLHERFAEWLERSRRENRIVSEEIGGYHLEQAFQYRGELGPLDDQARALGKRAAELLSAAGARALARGDDPAAANLLGRACSLLPADDAQRRVLLPDLAHALRWAGEFARAEAVLNETIEAARTAGDRRVELYASIGRVNLLSVTDPDFAMADLLEMAERAIPIFEGVGDQVGLTRSWSLVHWFNWHTCQMEAAAEAAQRTFEHARRAGDRREQAFMLGRLALTAMFGPTPGEQAERRCEEILERAEGVEMVESAVLRSRAVLTAMRGDFEEARSLVARSVALLDELGQPVQAAGASLQAGEIELLADDPQAAERVLRAAYARLEEMGERGILSTVAAFLAEALYRQGRSEEAEQFTRTSEYAAAPDDLWSQVLFRVARAKVLARRGEFEQAEVLARKGVELAETTDNIDMQADALLDLAEVLHLAGQPDETVQMIDEARRRYEQKGNLVSAEKARALLAEMVA
jgi:predicted ATPase/class 3 adenylate cyclase